MIVTIKHWLSEDYMRAGFEINSPANSYSCRQDCECPEDAIFGRNLQRYDSIKSLIEEAYLAGKNGELLEISEINE